MKAVESKILKLVTRKHRSRCSQRPRRPSSLNGLGFAVVGVGDLAVWQVFLEIGNSLACDFGFGEKQVGEFRQTLEMLQSRVSDLGLAEIKGSEFRQPLKMF
jgi:hypothetical protein